LPRVWGVNAVVHATSFLLARDIKIRPPIKVSVRSTDFPISSPTYLTLADVVGLAYRFDTVSIFIAFCPIRADPRSVRASNVLVPNIALYARSTIEASICIDANRVFDTTSIVVVALVDIIANLLLSGCIIEPNPCEASAAGVTRRTWTTPEARYKVIAGSSHITWISEVALVQVIARGSITCETSWTCPALIIRRSFYIIALHILETRRGDPLTYIWNTVNPISSVTLGTRTTSIKGILYYRITRYTLVTGLCTTGIPLTESSIPLISRWTGSAFHSLCCVQTIHTGRTLKAWIGKVGALWFLDLAGFTVL
jgi:hypothetical protein